MPDEKQDALADEVEDEMPDDGRAPCGHIFAEPDATYVTDADADVLEDQRRA